MNLRNQQPESLFSTSPYRPNLVALPACAFGFVSSTIHRPGHHSAAAAANAGSGYPDDHWRRAPGGYGNQLVVLCSVLPLPAHGLLTETFGGASPLQLFDVPSAAVSRRHHFVPCLLRRYLADDYPG
jgi:hypothetical protein